MSTTVLTASDISAYGSYLAHHGIKGQKWGVRRFQNPDGSLTAKGLKRQAKRFTRELNKNDKKLAVSRGHAYSLQNEIDYKNSKLAKAQSKGKDKKAARIQAKIDKMEAKKAGWESKTASVTNRQREIGEACKRLNLDISAKEKGRSTRTRGEKIGSVVFGVMMGVYTWSSVNGTKYKVRSNPKKAKNGSVNLYEKNNRMRRGYAIGAFNKSADVYSERTDVYHSSLY